jgi:N,N'-diacetyllegionaminate synthase
LTVGDTPLASTMIQIGNKTIGPGAPCFIIAEAGVNHNGSIDLALRLVDAAAQAGADAVKFQTFRAEHLVTEDAPMSSYQVINTGVEESQFAMLKRLELTEDHHHALMQRCKERGVLFMSTPFDEESANLLRQLGLVIFKTSSGDMTTAPFLRKIAEFGLPMIVSTGMADLSEVHEAVSTIQCAGNNEIVLLHCVSTYPAPASEMNLRAMVTMANATNCLVGLSDHTTGQAAAVAAVALGACVLEKHFTLDRLLPGPDHAVSLEPDELRSYVMAIRDAESAMGDGLKRPRACEEEARKLARKSLVSASDIAAGSVLSADMVICKRPGHGISPKDLEFLIGRTFQKNLSRGSLLTADHLVPIS